MLLLLVAGLVLRLTSGWFSGQHTVGDILIWVGAITTLVPLLIVMVTGSIAAVAFWRR